jgi:flagellar protein FliS
MVIGKQSKGAKMSNDLISEVRNATPLRLIEMLYARAVQDLEGAVTSMDLQGDPHSEAGAIHLIVHAQQIISELNNCLKDKSEDSGTQDLKENLKRLYEYMQYRLVEAIAKKDKNIIEEITGLLVELRECWSTMREMAESKGG